MTDDPPDSLDSAWAEVEAAMPEGWDILVGTSRKHGTEGYWASASSPYDEVLRTYSIVSSQYNGTAKADPPLPTPAAALLALADKLARR